MSIGGNYESIPAKSIAHSDIVHLTALLAEILKVEKIGKRMVAQARDGISAKTL